MMQTMRYTLTDFTDITFNGFDFQLPDETLSIITELALQVGSPTYIKTPIFAKRENPLKGSSVATSFGSSSSGGFVDPSFKRKQKRGKATEIYNDADWETIRTFEATKIEQRAGIDAQIDLVRLSLNKMSDKNYNEHCSKIMDILTQLITEGTSQEDMFRIGNAIFEIASNNRFYSKLYADLYTKLINNFEVMKIVFETSLSKFMELFNTIEHVNPDEDYDKFCKINKDNERRKALSSFFVNLTNNKIIGEDKLIEMVTNLLKQVLGFIHLDNKKNEIDEITENIAILYNKDLLEKYPVEIDGRTFIGNVEFLARSKVKTFPSLSSKSIFKFMDMIEM